MLVIDTLMRSLSSAALIIILSGACVRSTAVPADTPSTQHAADTVWWAPELGLDSLQSIPSHLERPFDEPFDVVARSDGHTRSAVATNCSTSLALTGQGYQPMTDNDAAAFKLVVATCQVLRALRSATPATAESLAHFRLDADALSVLPPVVGPQPNPTDVDGREAATRAGESWRAHDPTAVVERTGAGHAKVSGAGWTTELELLARGDFDGDGADDILLLALSYGAEGSWREVRLHQLTTNKGQPVLRLVKAL